MGRLNRGGKSFFVYRSAPADCLTGPSSSSIGGISIGRFSGCSSETCFFTFLTIFFFLAVEKGGKNRPIRFKKTKWIYRRHSDERSNDDAVVAYQTYTQKINKQRLLWHKNAQQQQQNVNICIIPRDVSF
jgi:hypothetical protein